MRTLIVFDIADDGRRNRVVKALLARAERVQLSVFDVPDLNRAAYLRLRSELEGIIEPREDDLRYYRLCAACLARLEHVGCGVGLLAPPSSFEIIG